MAELSRIHAARGEPYNRGMTERLLKSIRAALVTALGLALPGAMAAQGAAPKGEVKKAAPAAVAPVAETDPDVALARKAALDWLALVDASKFDATWDEAATSFQKGQKKAEWAKGLGGARPTMGKLISRTYLNHEIRPNLPNLPPGKYITVRFTSVFEKNPNGGESVTLIRDGARGYRAMSYFLK
jgi:hypothetical protein